MIRDYKKILAWQEAHALAKDVYRITANFPSSDGQVVLQASIDSACSKLAGLTRSVRKEIT